jgi:DNA replication protein DnaC
MLTEPTIDKLKTLRLDAMAAAWEAQRADAATHKLAFDERLGLLVDAEWLARENKRMARALKEARLRLSQACLEDIDYSPRRELDKAAIRQLASCRWIDESQNVLITGATGTGKTYLACALAQQACRKGKRANYRRASRLFDELTLARADGSFIRLLARLARVDVLIIDDWAMAPVKDQERRDILEVIEDRYGCRSTILTSQLPPSKWHDHLGDPNHADAICDRLLHNAHRLVLKGPSRRKEKEEQQTK